MKLAAVRVGRPNGREAHCAAFLPDVAWAECLVPGGVEELQGLYGFSIFVNTSATFAVSKVADVDQKDHPARLDDVPIQREERRAERD